MTSLLIKLSILIFIFCLPANTFAQEIVRSFDSNITAQKDGTIKVTENIEYDFGSGDRHGIYRFIPTVSKVGNLYRIIDINFKEVKRDGKNEKYKIDLSSKKAEVKIGDPDKTISGVHLYTIVYDVKNGIGSNYEDHDEIYWDATGNEWQVPILKASSKISTDFNVKADKYKCFTGVEGSKQENCTIIENTLIANGPLDPNEGFTIVASFPVNTFPKSILQKNEPFADPDFITFLKFYSAVWALLNFLLAPYLLYWYLKNKSKIKFGPPTVNFDFPKDDNSGRITPAEAGIIDNTKLEKNDVVATIFDLAIRKYLKIQEDKKVRKFAPDQTDYKLIKLKPFEGLNEFERNLMSGIFSGSESVKLSEIKKDFYLIFQKMEGEVFNSLVRKKLYSKNPKTQITLLFVFGIIAAATLNFILGPILIFLSKKLNGKTSTGLKADWEIDGLKIFLKSISRYHKWQAKNLITVEKYIPYAMALGLNDEFMSQLKVIYPEYSPAWYRGNGNFYSMYPIIYSSMNSNITTSAPSSSSGFSGGSSGGGGGGGGGGSW